ncbi:hypothetical protein NQ317_005027 [Molorchus minor]|uniref:acid phosphatase n=1 Tax=Molorchus minor TaxID=1323400 RepID=A0ABQ9JXH5_9CUCU|nr:hypothetical protein NQ317_005027 [Molorchus minor]
MLKYVYFVVFIVVSVHFIESKSEDELISVVALYRHGDRAPLASYKYDVYDESYWPFGFGQLTNIGKRQEYALGRWLRARYDGFLPQRYNAKDIKVYSSNVDRCLMSASANLAALYAPVDDQIWNEALPWQPIPIHTKPEKEDALLAQQKPCVKYNKLYAELMITDENIKNSFESIR